MARRGHGEGSISRRADGRYEGRYYADTPEGRKRKAVYGKTRKEVAEKLAKAIATKDEPAEFVRTNMTMQEFMAQYEEAAKGAMKRRSFETYRDIARCHLLPAFGNVKLSDLSRERVQKMYARKRDQGLSPARVRRIHGVLSAALNKAVLWRLVERNICKEAARLEYHHRRYGH